MLSVFPRPNRRSLLAFLLGIALLTSVAGAQPEQADPVEPSPVPTEQATEDKLLKLEEMQTPSVEELLTGRPKDWIVLTNTDEVLVVEALSPRPGTVEKAREAIAAKEEERTRATTAEDRERIRDELNELQSLVVLLPIDGSPEFRLPLRRVKQIIHHEDLMLRKIQELLAARNIEQSLELITRLQQTWETWEGMSEAYENILFTDALKRIDAGQPESALPVLDELIRRRKQYAGLDVQFGRAIRLLVDEALAQEDFLGAQFYLNHLQQRFADHAVFREFEAALTQRTKEVIALANAAAAKGDLRTAAIEVERAARIWPRTADLRVPHRTHTERYQRLHVGVLDLPGEATAYPVPVAADLRKQRLTELPLFEIDRVRDGTAYYTTRFFDEWEPFDLGREMKFTLKQYRQPSEMQAIVSTPDVVTPILQRLDPDHPLYDERLAALIASIRVQSPTEFSLTFHRVPPRLEPLLARIALSGQSSWGNGESTADVALVSTEEAEDDFGLLTDPGGFGVLEQTPERIVYRRKLEEPDNLPRFHVAEIVEHKYSTAEKAVQALLRGEVSVLPDLPDWIIRRMQKDEEFLKRFFVFQYMLPQTHLLQFNPASRPLRIRELRTALAYSVDRETLLSELVLRDPKAAHGRIVTTPFLSANPGRNVMIQPRRYDLSSAVAMLLTARRRMEGELPELTMVVTPGVEAEEAARAIARTWERIGLKIRVVFPHEPPPEKWDILYRSLQMTEPLVEMWPFLTFQDRARLSDLNIYPDWLKQELVDLDRTSDQGRSITALQTLHRHLSDDTAFVPLWELDRFIVLRKNVQGSPQRPLHSYSNVDRWSLDAWYQTELP